MIRIVGLAFALFSVPALAHHPLAGQEMATFMHGLLSGIGHPLLGFDHLFFVLLLGVAALTAGRAWTAPLAYLGAMLVGCLAVSQALVIPAVEPMVALSLLTLGVALVSGRKLSLLPLLALFAVGGIFHGAAFGESMAAAEASTRNEVLTGYLIGLLAIQYGLCVGAAQLLSRIWQVTSAEAVQVRLAGAMVAGVGLFLSMELLEGAAFSALGL